MKRKCCSWLILTLVGSDMMHRIDAFYTFVSHRLARNEYEEICCSSQLETTNLHGVKLQESIPLPCKFLFIVERRLICGWFAINSEASW